MSADETDGILAGLAAQGVSIWVEGGTLRYKPASAVSPSQRDQLRRNKATLMTRLSGADGTDWNEATGRLLAMCRDEASRNALREHIAKTITQFEVDQRLPLPRAQMQTFGCLLVYLLQACISRQIATAEQQIPKEIPSLFPENEVTVSPPKYRI